MLTTLQESIIAKLGLGAASAEKQTELLARMAQIIQKRIALRVMILLPEKAVFSNPKMILKSVSGF